jgi:putative transposase
MDSTIKLKSYKFRIYPNKKQQRQLYLEFAASKSVYNFFLDLSIKYREENKEQKKKFLNFYDWCNVLTYEKKTEEHKWWSEASSQSLVGSLKDLDFAYKNFFRNIKNGIKSGFPNFKKFNSSVRYHNQACKYDIDKHKIRLSKAGWINIKDYAPAFGRIINITISKSDNEMWFASICVEQKVKEYINKSENEIGIDVGIKDFLIDSNGNKISNPKFLIKSEKKLKRLQRQLGKKKIGSNNRKKAKLKLAKAHTVISEQRKNFLHQTSTKLVKENKTIYHEDLNISGMMKNHRLAKSFSDVSHYEFFRMLGYKGIWYNCKVEKIGRFEPSSKLCHVCGYKNNELTLKDREWTCPECNTKLDRDINAAINILEFGKNKI